MSSTGDTMLIVGDVYVRRDDPPSVFQHVRKQMNAADIMIGNLEGAYADSGDAWPKGEIPIWRAGAKQIEAIEVGGFHAMSVTNNHIMDFGYDGLFETLAHLDRIGVKHAGAGRNIAEAHAPAIVSRPHGRVALLAYTSVFAPDWDAQKDRAGLAVMRAKTAFEPDVRTIENPGKPPKVLTWVLEESKKKLAEDIAAARKEADIVLCSFHWGVSAGHIKLVDYQIELGHHAVDCGADLVFGHHPHVLQGIDVYRGVPIFYSLGNFSFARHTASKGHELETAMIRCIIKDKRIVSVAYLPVRSDANIDPHILKPSEATDITRLIAHRSSAFPTQFRELDDAIEIVLPER